MVCPLTLRQACNKFGDERMEKKQAEVKEKGIKLLYFDEKRNDMMTQEEFDAAIDAGHEELEVVQSKSLLKSAKEHCPVLCMPGMVTDAFFNFFEKDVLFGFVG